MFSFLKNLILPRYETDAMLRNYIVAQYGPYLTENPVAVSEEFYKSILGIAKKYIGPDTSAVDIGCATGRLVFEFEKLGAHAVIGIDSSKAFIDFCSAVKHQNAREVRYPVGDSISTFVKADIMDAKLSAESFQFVSCINIIDRVPDPAACIEVIRKALAPQGIALFADPYDWDLSPAPRHMHVQSIQALLDTNAWNILEETRIPFTMPIDETHLRTYDCHILVAEKR